MKLFLRAWLCMATRLEAITCAYYKGRRMSPV